LRYEWGVKAPDSVNVVPLTIKDATPNGLIAEDSTNKDFTLDKSTLTIRCIKNEDDPIKGYTYYCKVTNILGQKNKNGQ
jgi:hypothetical protein